MKKLFICAFLVYAASLQAQPMGKGNLPPVFPKEVAEKTQFDTRTRAYISPVRVMWTQNGDLITGSENLLLQGNGQATTANTPKTVFVSKEGKRPSILLDFGREIHGGLQFVTCIRASTKPVKVRVRLGESVGEAMCEITKENGATNDHAMRDYTIELPWLGVCEVGNSGFRFVRIDMLEDDVELPIKEIRASLLYRDIPYLGSFRSNDPRVDSIWATGAYTLHLNLQEYLVEAPKRDRLVWLGDLHPAGRIRRQRGAFARPGLRPRRNPAAGLDERHVLLFAVVGADPPRLLHVPRRPELPETAATIPQRPDEDPDEQGGRRRP